VDLVELALELFKATYAATPGDGEAWETVARTALARRGARFEQIPGGATLFGFASASGLPHQLDAVIRVEDAFVVLELKAHAGTVPKNDLLRFAAATDDFVFGLGSEFPALPVYRILATLGQVSIGMRRFAALRGIGMIERGRWPSMVLSAPSVVWPEADGRPTDRDREQIGRLVRPVQAVLRSVGAQYLYDPGLAQRTIVVLLALEDDWSNRLWVAVETRTQTLWHMGDRAA